MTLVTCPHCGGPAEEEEGLAFCEPCGTPGIPIKLWNTRVVTGVQIKPLRWREKQGAHGATFLIAEGMGFKLVVKQYSGWWDWALTSALVQETKGQFKTEQEAKDSVTAAYHKAVYKYLKPSVPTVTRTEIKPLEWSPYGGNQHGAKAESGLGVFLVVKTWDPGFYVTLPNCELPNPFPTLAEAKAKCEEWYHEKLSACLQLSAETMDGELVEVLERVASSTAVLNHLPPDAQEQICQALDRVRGKRDKPSKSVKGGQNHE